MNRLSAIEAYEETEIGANNWSAYLRPSIGRLKDDYATSLADALTRALDELCDPSLGFQHGVNGSRFAGLSKAGLVRVNLSKLEEVRDWCEQGAFDVRNTGPSCQTLSRP